VSRKKKKNNIEFKLVTIANYYDSGRSTKGRGELWKKKKEFGGVKMHVCVNMGVCMEMAKKLGSIISL
jgi:hypothetical protein